MADIELRFYHDMLIVASPIKQALRQFGVDVDRDLELTLMLEPETIEAALRLEAAAGAQVLVAPTAGLTPARLASSRLQDRAKELAHSAVKAVRAFRPQHVLVPLEPTGLPLNPYDKYSLRENSDQYVRTAKLFSDEIFDGFLLEGFDSIDELKCAVIGIRKVTGCPVFADVLVDKSGRMANGKGTIEEAVRMMEEYEVSVAGFTTTASPDDAAVLAMRAASATSHPLMVSLDIRKPVLAGSGVDYAYSSPDSMERAATVLREAGVQFLRATGDATPAYTSVLFASTTGLDVEIDI
ncbi:MAG: homocysteine S-methyltransferase family protein [Eggerthellaceae bacterium]|nr:homocysteine S-methyltransferase family protein [Eggerthellaceae bacterium]